VIFVTVGHQMPFDRLIRAVDHWSGQRGRSDVFAQIGAAEYVPRHCQWVRTISPAEFEQRMRQSSAIVGHAGTGTIIAALQFGKPLLVLPRLSRLGETRNDHQVPTARHFAQAGHVLAATDETQLPALLDTIELFRPATLLKDRASDQLLARLREFVFQDPAKPSRPARSTDAELASAQAQRSSWP
jgi:UDP-N-acetylglucosamine transferase subunit ALG13